MILSGSLVIGSLGNIQWNPIRDNPICGPLPAPNRPIPTSSSVVVTFIQAATPNRSAAAPQWKIPAL
jgi:hypothetical protein